MKKKIQIITIMMFVFLGVNAQEVGIYYKDYEPDTCKFITWSSFVPSSMDSMRIDLNCDGSYDMWITGYVQHGALLPKTFMSFGWELSYPNENTVLTSDTIRWENYDDWVSGSFHGKYGFRQKVGEEYFYGWMSAYCDTMHSKSYHNIIGRYIYVDRFVFCTIPNYPLRWGQTSLAEDIEENEDTSFAILHPNPTTNQVTITGQDLKTAEVFNTLGQTVATATGEGEKITINISNLPAGVYLVSITDGEGRKCVKKVVKE